MPNSITFISGQRRCPFSSSKVSRSGATKFKFSFTAALAQRQAVQRVNTLLQLNVMTKNVDNKKGSV